MVPRRKRAASTHVEDEWRAAAGRVGGRYESDPRLKTGTIVVVEPPWTVEVARTVIHTGTAVITITRSRALALARGRGQFRFRIHPRGKLGGLAALLGLGGVRLNDPRLQKTLVARSRDAGRVRTLARDPALAGPVVDFGLRLRFDRAPRKDRRRHGQDTWAVTVEADGLVFQADRLAAMVDLTRSSLARLAAVGAVDAATAPGGGPGQGGR